MLVTDFGIDMKRSNQVMAKPLILMSLGFVLIILMDSQFVNFFNGLIEKYAEI